MLSSREFVISSVNHLRELIVWDYLKQFFSSGESPYHSGNQNSSLKLCDGQAMFPAPQEQVFCLFVCLLMVLLFFFLFLLLCLVISPGLLHGVIRRRAYIWFKLLIRKETSYISTKHGGFYWTTLFEQTIFVNFLSPLNLEIPNNKT